MKCAFKFALLLVLALVPLVASSTPRHYPSLYVFGDSLSDTGNDFAVTQGLHWNPAVPPSVSPHRTYYQGRFSNGPVAVEYLWADLRATPAPMVLAVSPDAAPKAAAVNFAFGGATSGNSSPLPGGLQVPGFLGQVSMFEALLAGKRATPDALYFVWLGANDYLMAGTTDPVQVVANIRSGIARLHRAGARDFLVVNLPDLGLIPMVQASPTGSAALTALSMAHNALLAAAVEELRSSMPGVSIAFADVFKASQDLRATGIQFPPALEFFSPGASVCLFLNPVTCPDVDLNAPLPPFLFWDVEHPTTGVHSVLAEVIHAALGAALAGKPSFD